MPVTATAAAVAAAGSLLAGATAPVRVTIAAPGHTPRINTHWNYVVRATRAGRPVAGRITAQIVDPLGGRHPVEFGKGTKRITNLPFAGEFHDFIVWPPESRGIPLRFRVVVTVGRVTRTTDYAVTPRS
jgi:hypothetical protein